MAFVVGENCINCKHTDCVEVCPVDCFYEGPNFLVIHPDECIDCALCEPECPVNAIYSEDELPADQAAFIELNGELAKQWPNITIKRNSRSFDDLVKTLRLALSGNDAPDIVQANNTRSQMGEFVKAKQIIPLDPYMKAYGWDKRYSESIRSVVSYSPDELGFF